MTARATAHAGAAAVSASAVRVRGWQLHVLDMRTRMPFRYGIASMTALPHLFVRLDVEVGGRARVGLASEGLPPKWFTKDPTTSFRADLADMFDLIRHACALAVDAGAAATPFDWWRTVYAAQLAWGASRGYPPLLAGLGASLVERALIDAFCRATGLTFAGAVRRNAFGIDLGTLHGELAGVAPADLLPVRPLRRIVARHTVGLADPLADEDIPETERLDDGLPQSLAACVRAYGLTHFKLKLSGDVAHDLARLRRIAAVLDEAAGDNHAFTIDGNEQYKTVAQFEDAWRAFLAEPALRGFFRHLLFVEQPLHRDAALDEDAARELRSWNERPQLIIDESDGTPDALPRALAAGYAGTSHKNCKGVFRGLANACLLAKRRAEEPSRTSILSGEDLANVGPVALLQDLAAMATLGVEHVERNGHHYFRGLSMLPKAVQRHVLEQHGDVYRAHPDGFPTLAIDHGRVDVGSVVDAPFGTAFLVDSTQFTPLDAWDFATLGVRE